VLLINGTRPRLDGPTVDALRKLGVRSATIIGGTGVVPDSVQRHLGELGMTTKRLHGLDRYATNEAIVKAYFSSSALKVLFASGAGFPDALSASVLAGRWKVPLLLTRQSCVVPGAMDFMLKSATESAVLIGGPGVLDEGVVAMRRC
jgi:putative cell wall-binding protein